MTSNDTPEDESSEVAVPQAVKAVDDQLIEELVGRAQAEGLLPLLVSACSPECGRAARRRPGLHPLTAQGRQSRSTAV